MKCLPVLKGLLICLLLLNIFACNIKGDRQVKRGFYYWKTNVNISDYEKNYMNSLKSELLYVRFFDVEFDKVSKRVKPLAIANFGSSFDQQHIVPVVYITQNALNAMQWNDLDFYAENIASLLADKLEVAKLKVEEIQIDCDWTKTNKDLYFDLLNKLKRQEVFKDKLISVTIRLHQVKYVAAAGIPPVDKGLLMVYNIDNLRDFRTENSILNPASAKQYLSNLSAYPLALDVALPIFSWTLLFEDEQFKGIIRGLTEEEILKNPNIQKIKDNRFKVLSNTMLRDYELKKDNVLRFENSEINQVKDMASFISKRIKSDSLHLLLYHCDSLNFSQYSSYELEKIFSSFD